MKKVTLLTAAIAAVFTVGLANAAPTAYVKRIADTAAATTMNGAATPNGQAQTPDEEALPGDDADQNVVPSADNDDAALGSSDAGQTSDTLPDSTNADMDQD